MNIIQPFIALIKADLIEIYEILANEIQNMINEVIDNPNLIIDNEDNKM